MRLALAAFLIGAMGSPLHAADMPTHLFVAADGSGPSCQDQRPCSLESARAKIRALPDRWDADVVVHLRGGIYRLTAPLTFTAADSGKGGHKVVYESDPASPARFSGGLALNGWHRRGDGLVALRLPSAVDFRQLYVDGARATRARSDPGYRGGVTWAPNDLSVSIPTDAKLTIVPGETEFVVNRHWQQHRLRILSAVVGGDGRTTLRFMAGDAYASFTDPGGTRDDKSTFYLENGRAFLDKPGEWFLDRSTSTLLYKPLAGQSPREMVVPALQTLVRLEGTTDQPVHDITFRGIVFEHAGWEQPSREGFGQIQSVWLTGPNGLRFMPAGVEVRGIGAHGIAFERSTFRNMGATGLAFFKGTRDNKVVGNVFHDLAGGGLAVDADPDRLDIGGPASSGFEVSDNLVYNIGTDYTGSVGMFFGYLANSRIEHNELRDLPYSGMSIGWGWTDKDNASKNNLVRANRIYRVMRIHDDGGAIYMLSKQPGTLISENFISDLRLAPYSPNWPIAGIYLDNGTEGVTVRDNVFINVAQPMNQNLTNDPSRGQIPARNNVFSNNDGRSASVMKDSGVGAAYRSVDR